MDIRILGTAACIGQPGLTTCLLLGQDTLLDCGTGCGSLAAEEMLRLRRVLLTHSHIDHCGLLPLLADVHACLRGPGLDVYAHEATLDALREHVFNGCIWPDYTRQPAPDAPWLRLKPVDVGDTVALEDGLATALPAEHSVPALGWLIEGPWRALAFSGDSAPCPAFWQRLAGTPALTDVICEVTYSDERLHDAQQQARMVPALLGSLLPQLPANVHLWLTHIDPSCREAVMQQMLNRCPPGMHTCLLKEGTLIEL
ncbi:3',5'-cyclic-nucleotide phosphodiesterase [Chromobacterium sp. ASV23]|uniref:3',5'-cyclic-nucleotide phosphodiesterase n=1 Tax=Chromobacterium sp. ASV23 TaxID=2795110 RepID=UPI0018ECFBF3|nr:3',5'-cyclic-nucleotide phosphodiesterase [Chromobacterium sp. ASV23]